MWSQFFLENIHFTVNLFAALVMFGMFWLYFDAWIGRKTLKEGLRWSGFLLLSIAFLIHSTLVESTIINSLAAVNDINNLVTILSKVVGLILIIVSLVIDPMQSKPK